MALMIDLHHIVHTSGGRGRKHRGMIDCCCDDAGTNPPPAQRQSEDGSLTCVYAGGGEDDLVRSCSHGGCYHAASLVQGLGGKAPRPVEPDRISPPCLLRIEPSLARIGDYWLARRAVQEDLRNGMWHASKLAREPPRQVLAVPHSKPPKTRPIHP
jgi:hypothetical protein